MIRRNEKGLWVIDPFFDKLQCQIRPSPLVADVVNLDDVRMLQAAERLRFSIETFEEIWIITKGTDHHLDRNQTVQMGIGCLIDNPHTSAADYVDDIVFPDLRGYV